MKLSRFSSLVVLYPLLSGCTLYQADPLGLGSLLSGDVGDIRVDQSELSEPQLANYKFDLADGMDMTEVAIVAAIRNPDLKLARDDAKISHAQSFTAGLLPDPQLSLSLDHPLSSTGGLINALSGAVATDLGPLLAAPLQLGITKSDNQQADLTLLWTELQTISQARTLFTQALSADQQTQTLLAYQTELAPACPQLHQALAQHQVALDTAGPYLTACDDLAAKVNDAQRQALKAHADLNALLALEPGTQIKLVTTTTVAVVEPSQVTALSANIEHRRPDLMALATGYNSQDKKYREAILAQFPAINFGFSRSRDNSNLQTAGLSLGITLPIFNGGRGAVAIEGATRAKLHDEYQIRLDEARSGIKLVLLDAPLLAEQLAHVRASLAELEHNAAFARSAYAAHNIDLFSWLSSLGALNEKRMELMTLEQTAREQQIVLDTLLATDLASSPAGANIHENN